MLVDHSDDLLPLLIPTKSGTTHALRIVLANSKEDKELLEVMRNVYPLCMPPNFFLWKYLQFNCRESFRILKRRRARKFVDFER